MDKRAIGVFDSGVGGLTVVKQLMKVMPDEKIIYFGDTARVPYGNKSKETVTRFSRQIINFLLTKDVKAVVIACNTVSSNCLDTLKNEYDIPLFGVVTPGATEAANATKNKKVGVIGTLATIRSGAYEKSIKQMDNNIEVYSKPCPLFVPLAEEGFTDCEISTLVAKEYLKDITKYNVDTVLLGCTHYPLLKKCIGEVIGMDIKLIDPAFATAVSVKNYLTQNNMFSTDKNPNHEFYVSDTTPTFDRICEIALKTSFSHIETDIEKY